MATMTKPTLKELTRHLWRSGNYAYWWGLSQDGETKETHWFPVDKPESPSKAWGDSHQYFGVHPTTINGSKSQRATNATVAAVNCLFADFDAKDEVLPDEYGPYLSDGFDNLKPTDQKTAIKTAQETAMMLDLPKYKARALARVQQCPLCPTWLIDSGGGYQCYWLLADTVMIDDGNRERVKLLQSEWVKSIGADDVKDLARVLRMPGSANVKAYFAPNYPIVNVVEHDDSRLYSLADFEALTGVDDVWMAAKDAKPRARDAREPSGCDSVIDKYNATVKIGDLLTPRGYQLGKSFKGIERYSRPGRDKGQTSVVVWLVRNRSYHHSSSDPLHCGDHSRDAFDVFTQLEHGGDASTAYIAAKKELGMWEERPTKPTGNGAVNDAATLALLTSNATDDSEPEGPHPLEIQPTRTLNLGWVDRYAGLPRIQVNNRQLNKVLDDALAGLTRRNSLTPAAPVAYSRGGQLSRVLPSSKTVQPITQSALTGIFADVADWISVKSVKKSEPETVISNVYPPREVVNTFLGLGEWPALPELVGVVSAPAYAGNGHWVQAAGYDAVSGLYLVDNLEIGDTTPTIERVEWAKSQILVELLGDFPFKDDASGAHAVALVLLPFVRHFIPGATPLHLADAPTPGTGKGLFVSACCFPALGEEVPSMTAGKDDDEWRKRLTALLQTGGSHANIDNITGKLESASLSAALTQAIWEDRQLGATHMLRLPIRTIWTATANNVQPDQDIARRCIWIRIDSNMERPQERTDFRHPKLLSWAKEHRGELVTAAMILVNNWIKQGEPAGKYVKGSYQAWAETMGGILDAAGIAGFLGNERELSDTAVNEGQAWKAFVEAWADAHHDQWVTTKDLFPIASHYDPPATAQELGLLDDLLGAGNERSRQTRLGKQLGQMADRVISGWKVSRGKLVDGYQQWRLVQIF